MKLITVQRLSKIHKASNMLMVLSCTIIAVASLYMDIGKSRIDEQLNLIKKRQEEAATLVSKIKALEEEAKTNSGANLSIINLQKKNKIKALYQLTSQNTNSIKVIQDLVRETGYRLIKSSQIRLYAYFSFFLFLAIFFMARIMIRRNELFAEQASPQDAELLRL